MFQYSKSKEEEKLYYSYAIPPLENPCLQIGSSSIIIKLRIKTLKEGPVVWPFLQIQWWQQPTLLLLPAESCLVLVLVLLGIGIGIFNPAESCLALLISPNIASTININTIYITTITFNDLMATFIILMGHLSLISINMTWLESLDPFQFWPARKWPRSSSQWCRGGCKPGKQIQFVVFFQSHCHHHNFAVIRI